MNHHPSESFLAICHTPVATAARELLYEDALAIFGASTTPWALAVRELLHGTPSETATEMNATSRWLAQNARAVYTSLTNHLKAKMPRSSELGVVEDHIQEFLTKLVKDDRLAPVLTAGASPKLSVLRVWAYQNATTQIRRWGVDAATRTLRGAKTSREIARGVSFKPVQAAAPAREIVSVSDDGVSSVHDIVDPAAPTPEEIASHHSRIEHVRATLLRKGAGNLVPVIDGLLEGMSLQEIQTRFGVSEKRLSRALRCLQDVQA